MFQFRYAKKFEKSVSKLPDKIKKKLPQTLLLLQEDPRHNSLFTKKNHSASKIFKYLVYESRIDNKYRILWKYEGRKVILLLTAGDHGS
ncbi:MAG: hypothetical protein WBA54_09380 [Acidaminobacteraceae bacterium]